MGTSPSVDCSSAKTMVSIVFFQNNNSELAIALSIALTWKIQSPEHSELHGQIPDYIIGNKSETVTKMTGIGLKGCLDFINNVPSCSIIGACGNLLHNNNYYISQLDILYPYNPPKHGHSEQFEHLSKSAAPTVKKI